MRENITKVAERGERLDQLQDKTGESFKLQSELCLDRVPKPRLPGDGQARSQNRTLTSESQITWQYQRKASVAVQTEYERCAYHPPDAVVYNDTHCFPNRICGKHHISISSGFERAQSDILSLCRVGGRI